MRARPLALALALAAGLSTPAAGQTFDWNDLGTEFCTLTLTGDMAGMGQILTRSLTELIGAASANPALPPARTLFQTYTNPVPLCRVRTRNAALVEITRSNAGGGAPAWSDYLVVIPERDGTTRIDDVLFATSKSDTLRSRLERYARGERP
jgi:hypothetical protein